VIERLLALLAVFAPLSLLSLGGGSSIITEMQRQSVDVHHWMTQTDFVDLYAISRAAPGPGSLIAALVGWRAGGFFGALAATAGMFLPSSVLVYVVGRWWRGRQDTPWRRAIERGLAPVAVGLVAAGGWTVLQGDNAGVVQVSTALLALLLLLRDVSPYFVLSAVAVLYGVAQAAGFASAG
jgi:chromate transporter